MRKTSFPKYFIIYLICANLLLSCNQNNNKANKVILLIGDGMGVAQVSAGMVANKTKLNIERSQYCGFSKTQSATNYITDSGAGGTAIATGTKTKNYAIAVDTNDVPLKTIVEYAIEKKLSTGVVSSSNLAHATPASFVAHQPQRKNTKEIALDFLKNDMDVLIGGGKGVFVEQGITEALQKKGYQVAFHMDSIDRMNKARLACFIGHNHPSKVLDGRGDMLPNATQLALDKLSQNSNGFFLMVEGSQIDWAGHANDINYMMSEIIDFDKAVGIAYDFADENPGTLVIVTADHETGGLTLPYENIPGDSVKAKFSTGGHTGVMVPIFAYGSGAEEFSQIMENTDIFYKIIDVLNLKK